MATPIHSSSEDSMEPPRLTHKPSSSTSTITPSDVVRSPSGQPPQTSSPASAPTPLPPSSHLLPIPYPKHHTLPTSSSQSSPGPSRSPYLTAADPTGGSRSSSRSRRARASSQSSPGPAAPSSLNRVVSNPTQGADDGYESDVERHPRRKYRTMSAGASSFSRSPGRGFSLATEGHPQSSLQSFESGDESEGEEEKTSWWHFGDRKNTRKLTAASVPEEVEGLTTTRDHVSQAIFDLLTDESRAKLSKSSPKAVTTSTPKSGKQRLKGALDTTADVAHEVLTVAAEALEFVPIPGLATGAKLVLMMWDSCGKVDMNRTACLRLTQRCADILISVREEILEAGDQVTLELEQPLGRLVEAFTQVNNFLLKLTRRPFLKRYLKRDEILEQIQDCDRVLGDVVSVFGLSIQIRMLRQAQAAEAARQRDTNRLLQALLANQNHQNQNPSLPSLAQSGNALLLTGVSESPSPVITTGPSPYGVQGSTPSAINLVDFQQAQIRNLSPPTNTSDLPPETDPISFPEGPSYDPFGVNEAWATNFPLPPHFSPPLPWQSTSLNEDQQGSASPQTQLRSLQSKQNITDAQLDVASLRTRMQEALGKGSDADIINCLQVRQDESPEAIKALQRALERLSDEDVDGSQSERFPPQRRNTTGSRAAESLKKADSSRGSRSSTESFQQIDATQGEGLSRRSSGRGRGDTLDREFMESGIDALRRMSITAGTDMAVPSWTITKYEIDRQARIGMGFFSNVYRGTYRGQKVAIKVLTPTTPRALFIKEVSIWKELRHSNVLELIGASSATSDPPWFLVSPFMKNGTLVEYLRNFRDSLAEGTLLKMMVQVANGMDYLHSRGVLHGDLKAANILVDDRRRCVISDFGQSELKSEAYRLSGAKPPHGTLRWQAPELLMGSDRLTTEMDVYAFGICCVEILSYGRLPWFNLDDDTVRDNVFNHRRPEIPSRNPQLIALIQRCWHQDQLSRPRFSRIVEELRRIRFTADPTATEEPTLPIPMHEKRNSSKASPDMRPFQLVEDSSPGHSDSSGSYRTARDGMSQSPPSVGRPRQGRRAITLLQPHPEDHLAEPTVSETRLGESVVMTRADNDGAISFVIDTTTTSASSTTEEEDERPPARRRVVIDVGYESPAPANEIIASVKNERRYRLLLQHEEYHPSLILPLWTPVPVSLGAVGYLSKPRGTFITLFNSFEPDKTSGGRAQRLPSLYGYAKDNKIERGSHRQEKRTAVQRVSDAFNSFFKGGKSNDTPSHVSRTYSFPLRAGHKTAYLVAESTLYQYVTKLDAPKSWFKANVDDILELYGAGHRITREDLCLVIGTLDAPDHAQFVSHKHPNGNVHFNVYQSPRAGQPWGGFTVDNVAESAGPSYGEVPTSHRKYASQVSKASGPWETVLVARLRFKPDGTDPTSL